MNAPTVNALQALQEKLKEISPEKGYHTDLNENVVCGFAGWELSNNPTTPLVIVSHGPTEAGQQASAKAKLEYSPEILIAVSNTEEASIKLANLENDVRRCLFKPFGSRALEGKAITVQEQGANPVITEDSKYALSIIPVTLTIIENYEA